jgi:hypothetical protein
VAHDGQRQAVAESLDEFALASRGKLVGELLGLRADERPQIVDHPRGEGLAHQAAQPQVIFAVLIDDHRDVPVIDRPGEDAAGLLHVSLSVVVKPPVPQQFLPFCVAQDEQTHRGFRVPALFLGRGNFGRMEIESWIEHVEERGS